VLQFLAELGECPVQCALDRAGRHAEGGGRFVGGHLFPVAKDQDGELLGRQRFDDVHEQCTVGVLLGPVLDGRVRQVVGGEFFEFPGPPPLGAGVDHDAAQVGVREAFVRYALPPVVGA
jgi:hypothetical protein